MQEAVDLQPGGALRETFLRNFAFDSGDSIGNERIGSDLLCEF
jgi:hypothetical protein